MNKTPYYNRISIPEPVCTWKYTGVNIDPYSVNEEEYTVQQDLECLMAAGLAQIHTKEMIDIIGDVVIEHTVTIMGTEVNVCDWVVEHYNKDNSIKYIEILEQEELDERYAIGTFREELRMELTDLLQVEESVIFEYRGNLHDIHRGSLWRPLGMYAKIPTLSWTTSGNWEYILEMWLNRNEIHILTEAELELTPDEYFKGGAHGNQKAEN